jgi:excisionase family DNA binding protein
MAARKKRAPAQTSFIKPAPQVKNGDVLDVAEAALLLKVSRETIYKRVRDHTIPHARVGRKILFSRQRLTQWVANGADLAPPHADDNEQLSRDELASMLNTGQARIGPKRP